MSSLSPLPSSLISRDSSCLWFQTDCKTSRKKMSVFSRLRNQTLQWWYDVPLPACEADAIPTFHPWYRFDSSVNKWVPFYSTSRLTRTGYKPSNGGKFVLVTWNVDATSPAPEARISALISYIQSLATSVDIIFLQEVSRSALLALLGMP